MKIGVVGCGNIATYHLPAILSHQGVQAVSVADVDRQKAEEIARRFRVNKIYSDLAIMIREQQPTAVHILTPPSTHAALAIEAMEAGCHVLVEKPMALTVEEADAMIAAAKTNGVKLCVDHNFLFDPLITEARQLVHEGKVGRVIHVETYYSFDTVRLRTVHGSPNGQTHWCFSLPGGLLQDSLPHPLSVLLEFVKDPVNVWAVKKSNGILPEHAPDELRVLIETKEATASLSVSLGTRPDCFTVNIYGSEMSIHVNLSNVTIVRRKNRLLPKKIFRFLDTFDQAMQLLYGASSSAIKLLLGRIQPPGDVGPVIRKFYESLENGSAPPVTGEAGKTVVRLMNEIWKQAT